VQENRQRAKRRRVRVEEISGLDGPANARQDNPSLLPAEGQLQRQPDPVSLFKLCSQAVNPDQQAVRIQFTESLRMIQVKVERHIILPKKNVAQGIAQVR
jgi:hypothetical protein